MQTFHLGQHLLIYEITQMSDIICLSEHALYEQEHYELRDVLTGFKGEIKQSSDLNSDKYSRVQDHCWLAIFWKNYLSSVVKPLCDIKSDCICGIKLATSTSQHLYIFVMYLPQPGCTLVSYYDVLVELELQVKMYKSDGNIIIMGEVNAHFGMHMGSCAWGKTNHSGSVLSKFIHRSSLYIDHHLNAQDLGIHLNHHWEIGLILITVLYL